MTRNRKILLAGVTFAALGLAGAGAYAARGDWGPGGWGGHGWRHHGGGGIGAFGFDGPAGRFCRGDGEERAEHVMLRLEYKVKPTDAQKAPFEELKAAAKTAAQKMQAACPEQAKAPDDGTPRPRLSPIDRLDRTEKRLEAQLDAIKTVRPAAEKFYASLSDDQKTKLTQQRWGGKRGEGRRGPDDGGPKPDAPAPQPE
jgi:hypothetical protein